MLEILYNLDLAILHFFNITLANPALDLFTIAYTQYLFPIILILAPLLVLIFDKKNGKTIFVMIISVYILALIVSFSSEHLVFRTRPYLALDTVRFLVTDSGFSCPSNHAMFSFVLATILSKKYGHSLIFYLLAVVMALSRVYMGLHYPSDILLGAIIGIILSLIALNNEDRINDLLNKIKSFRQSN